MKCFNCENGKFVEVKENYIKKFKYIGSVEVENATFEKCFECNEKIIPSKLIKKIEEQKKEIISDYLKTKPIDDFLDRSELADRFEISRQAISKNKKMQKNIFNYMRKETQQMFFLPSIKQFELTGDGRFDIDKNSLVSKSETLDKDKKYNISYTNKIKHIQFPDSKAIEK